MPPEPLVSPPTQLPMTARDLVEVRVPHSPHISPDGRRAVFAVDEADFEESRLTTHLWIADLTSGTSRRITFSYEGEHSPRWSPNGRWIAFLSARPDPSDPDRRDGSDAPREDHEQVWVMPADGGEAERLTKLRDGVRDFAWLPDSSAIVALAPEPRPTPIQQARDEAQKHGCDSIEEHEERPRIGFWEIDLEERKPFLLHPGDPGVTDFDVSPDGRWIAFTTNRTGDPNDYHHHDLCVLDADDAQAEPRLACDRPGAKWRPHWSPDGSRLLYVGNVRSEISFSPTARISDITAFFRFMIPNTDKSALRLFPKECCIMRS